MEATLFNVPSLVTDMVFDYCTGRDVVNFAACSKQCNEMVHELMWTSMNIQWAHLDDMATVKLKTKFLGLTEGLQHILEQCVPQKL